jgi:hypothetical protein
MSPEYIDPVTIEVEQREQLVDDVAPWRDKFPDVPVKSVVALGSAADVLIGVSKSAQLVVAGPAATEASPACCSGRSASS